VWYWPVRNAKTIPLILMGVPGETISRETQAGCSLVLPSIATTLYASTAPLVIWPLFTGKLASAGRAVAPAEKKSAGCRERWRMVVGCAEGWAVQQGALAGKYETERCFRTAPAL